jgi:hypothetical protein
MKIITIFFFTPIKLTQSISYNLRKKERERSREPTYHIHHIEQETKHPNNLLSIWQEQPNIHLMEILSTMKETILFPLKIHPINH